jgi:putative SOS response-associated peptidase YedK
MTLTIPDAASLCALLGVPFESEAAEAEYRPRYNVAPSQPHVVMVQMNTRSLRWALWGLGTHHQTNTRIETLLSSTSQRLTKRKRCIVPADGFFEWTGPRTGRRPTWFHPSGASLLLFPGMVAHSADGLRFVVLTTAAKDIVADIHDRMPVMLSAAQADGWLEGGSDHLLRELLLHPLAPPLLASPVSSRVNNVANDDEECLASQDGPGEQLKLL